MTTHNPIQTYYTINNKNGRVYPKTSQSSIPDITDIDSIDANGHWSSYIKDIDDKFINGGIIKLSPEDSILNPMNYQTEYLLFVQDVSGVENFYNFLVPPSVSGVGQGMSGGGITMSADITLFEHTDDHGFEIWKGNGSGYVLGLYNVGPGNSGDTGSMGTATSPGTTGEGDGRLTFDDDSTNTHCEVYSIVQVINPNQFRQECINFEVSGLTQPDYSAIVYGTGGSTMDLSSTTTSLSEKYHTVKTNHDIWGTADFGPTGTGGNTIRTVTVYDASGSGITINALTGGQGTATGQLPHRIISELNSLYYNWFTASDTYDTEVIEIQEAYKEAGVSGDNFIIDSVHKIRTILESRNP